MAAVANLSDWATAVLWNGDKGKYKGHLICIRAMSSFPLEVITQYYTLDATILGPFKT